MLRKPENSLAVNFTALAVFILVFSLHLVKCAPQNKNQENAVSTDLEKELTMTEEQQTMFEKFKDSVYNLIPKEMVILRTDLYFVRYLRGKKWDLSAAKRDFTPLLFGIRSQNLTGILEEDFTDMEQDFPVHYGTSWEGLPVIHIPTGVGWDVKRAFMQGKLSRMIRYSFKVIVEIQFKLAEASAISNGNVNQIIIIVDLIGFFDKFVPESQNITCNKACAKGLIRGVELVQSWIPGYIHEIIVINAPDILITMWETLRPMFSIKVSSLLTAFGEDKNDWWPYLEKKLDLTQLQKYLK